jgi:glycosyltransferase involved in cell wall biosynthesis
MVAPLMEPVPPPLYGGTERVISLLTEELVRRGHAVTLFASGDSQSAADLVPCCERGLRLDKCVTDYVAYAMTELGEVYRRAGDFDVTHNHLDYLAFPSARLSPTATLTTTHGRIALPDLIEFVGEVDEAGKDDLLGGAWACLFPIDWPEPFGVTMAEAMATRTPVVAYRAGSVPEVVEHGTTGFVCETISGDDRGGRSGRGSGPAGVPGAGRTVVFPGGDGGRSRARLRRGRRVPITRRRGSAPNTNNGEIE